MTPKMIRDDGRLDGIEVRLTTIDARLNAIEVRLAILDGKLVRLTWMVGLSIVLGVAILLKLFIH